MDVKNTDFSKEEGVCGVLLQNPDLHGNVNDFEGKISEIHESGALAVVATDLLACTLMKPPGD